jgi:hypothetical protein
MTEERRRMKLALKLYESEIRNILNRWNPISSDLEDEYDHLNTRIISALLKGAGQTEIERLIDSYLVDQMQIREDREAVQSVAQDIMNFWSVKL